MKRWAILAVLAATLSPVALRAAPWDLFSGGLDVKDWGFGANVTLAHLRNDRTDMTHSQKISTHFDRDDVLLEVYAEQTISRLEERSTRLRYGFADVTFDAKSSLLTKRDDIEATAAYVGVVQGYDATEVGLRFLHGAEFLFEADLGVAFLRSIRETSGAKELLYRKSTDPFLGFGVALAYPLGNHMSASVGWRWRHFGDFEGTRDRFTRDFDVETYGFEGGLTFRF